jgi:hypothetical protein
MLLFDRENIKPCFFCRGTYFIIQSRYQRRAKVQRHSVKEQERYHGHQRDQDRSRNPAPGEQSKKMRKFLYLYYHIKIDSVMFRIKFSSKDIFQALLLLFRFPEPHSLFPVRGIFAPALSSFRWLWYGFKTGLSPGA